MTKPRPQTVEDALTEARRRFGDRAGTAWATRPRERPDDDRAGPTYATPADEADALAEVRRRFPNGVRPL